VLVGEGRAVEAMDVENLSVNNFKDRKKFQPVPLVTKCIWFAFVMSMSTIIRHPLDISSILPTRD
jgi:hypothetical protein